MFVEREVGLVGDALAKSNDAMLEFGVSLLGAAEKCDEIAAASARLSAQLREYAKGV